MTDTLSVMYFMLLWVKDVEGFGGPYHPSLNTSTTLMLAPYPVLDQVMDLGQMTPDLENEASRVGLMMVGK